MQDQEFQKYFPTKDEEDEHTRIARFGSTHLITQDSGKARFVEQSIADYFVAKVLYQFIIEYDEDDEIPLEESYLSKRLIYNDDQMMASYVLNFLTSRIRSKTQKGKYEIQKNVEDTLKGWIKKITRKNMDEIYNKNVLTLSSQFEEVFGTVPGEILEEMLKTAPESLNDTQIPFRVNLLMYLYEKENKRGNTVEAKEILIQIIEIQLKGKYKGAYIFDQNNLVQKVVLAHG